MKKRLTLALLLLLTSFSAFAQDEIQYKEYSYTEFFQMIADEEDSVFSLDDALIKPNPETDQRFFAKWHGYPTVKINPILTSADSIIIDKELILTNVQFLFAFESIGNKVAILHNINFKKKVKMENVLSFFISDCSFNEEVLIQLNDDAQQIFDNSNIKFALSMIHNSGFKNGISYGEFGIGNKAKTSTVFTIVNSELNEGTGSLSFSNRNQLSFGLIDNKIIGEGIGIRSDGAENYDIIGNHFDVQSVRIFNPLNDKAEYNFQKNIFSGFIGLGINPNENTVIDWSQFNGRAIVVDVYYDESERLHDEDSLLKGTKDILKRYYNKSRVENASVYKAEQRIKGRFINLYKAQNDMEFANMVYVESKDLETARLAYLFKKDPHFDTFFSWKINQFLKIFSVYGTKPSRAIIFSIYVILAFALVYLLFPNHWDAHGKDRILHRYQFFFKYLNKDAGMHDVYLDGKKDELAHYDGFKNFFIENGKTVPKFFLATALPLYRWSTASTRSSSWFLQKIDIFKGKWADLPAPQRAAKTVLLTLAFTIALTYDILIKMLNALMLSINTFTTLGFGEIPIKGLPRYLAIIQGFIGWFMLTIFSVSLISQLLN